MGRGRAAPGDADAGGWSGKTIDQYQTGVGSVRFHRAAWSDLPTMYHVVNALAALPIIEPRGGAVIHSRGGKTFRDQRVLV